MSLESVRIFGSDRALLPYLAKHLLEPSCTILEKDGEYYLLSSDFMDSMTADQIYEVTDKLLEVLNSIIKLKYGVGNALSRNREVFPSQKEPSELNRIDDHNRLVTVRTRGIAARFVLSVGEDFLLAADQQKPSILTLWRKARKYSMIRKALCYYGKQANWHDLYSVYEIIIKNTKKLIGRGKISQATFNSWVIDTSGRNREKDFTETANNFNISGTAARHTAEASHKIIRRRGSSSVTVLEPQKRGKSYKKIVIIPLSISEAEIFIGNLLKSWIKTKK